MSSLTLSSSRTYPEHRLGPLGMEHRRLGGLHLRLRNDHKLCLPYGTQHPGRPLPDWQLPLMVLKIAVAHRLITPIAIRIIGPIYHLLAHPVRPLTGLLLPSHHHLHLRDRLLSIVCSSPSDLTYIYRISNSALRVAPPVHLLVGFLSIIH